MLTTLNRLINKLIKILPDKFYGEVNIKFENGKIVSLKKIESVEINKR